MTKKTLALATTAILAWQPQTQAATPITQAIPAAKFLDSLGVNTHINSTSPTAYGNIAQVENELQYTGIRYARDDISLQSSLASLQKVNQDIGTKYDILVSPNLPSQMAELQANTPLIAEVEGPNEIDNWPVTFNGSRGYPAAVALQKQLYADMNATPALAPFPVDSLSIADAGYLSRVGNLAPYADYATSHVYPQFGGGAATPIDNLEWSLETNAILAPGKPPTVTEFGWWTQPMDDGIPTDVHAKYTLSFFLDAFTMGAHRSYIYELNDEKADSRNSTIEYHFGLFDAAGNPKPAATALNYMTRILADPTPVAAPSGLPFTVTAAGRHPIKHLLMQRGDGTFILALWQDAAVWNYTTGQKLMVADEQATINFGITASSVQVYDPILAAIAITSYTNTPTLKQYVPDHPIFIFIKK